MVDEETHSHVNPFTRVPLETADGEYVTTALIPSFKTWPEVLTWGSRVFYIQAKGPGYREVSAVAVVKTTGRSET